VFQHRALEEAELGPAVWRVVGDNAPAPLRGMVARGLAPLPPRDMLVALYQLWVTNDPDLAAVAAKTVEGLPRPILFGALDDAKLPPGVLDFLGRKLPSHADVLDRVIRHRNVDDGTLSGIARVCPESVCDVLADNQERWLACPAIVESLYQNPNCRMSVIHRVLELAVRENIDVRLPNMDEIRQALLEGSPAEPEGDAVFKDAAGAAVQEQHSRVVEKVKSAAATEALDFDAAIDEGLSRADLESLFDHAATDELSLPVEDEGEDAPAKPVPVPPKIEEKLGDSVWAISQLKPMAKIRLALLGTTFQRFVLVRDANKAVAMSAIKSPKVNENEVVAHAANRALGRDVISYIAKRRDWTKLYLVQKNLVLNPKTPMALAMNFLNRLHAHDVKKVAFSKNIPSALAVAARRRMEQRK